MQKMSMEEIFKRSCLKQEGVIQEKDFVKKHLWGKRYVITGIEPDEDILHGMIEDESYLLDAEALEYDQDKIKEVIKNMNLFCRKLDNTYFTDESILEELWHILENTLWHHCTEQQVAFVRELCKTRFGALHMDQIALKWSDVQSPSTTRMYRKSIIVGFSVPDYIIRQVLSQSENIQSCFSNLMDIFKKIRLPQRLECGHFTRRDFKKGQTVYLATTVYGKSDCSIDIGQIKEIGRKYLTVVVDQEEIKFNLENLYRVTDDFKYKSKIFLRKEDAKNYFLKKCWLSGIKNYFTHSLEDTLDFQTVKKMAENMPQYMIKQCTPEIYDKIEK